MPPLIFVEPNTAHYALTPDKYAALVLALGSNQDASNLKVTNAASGSVTYQKIDFTWQYDGVAQLTIVIVADRNWKAKLAGNEVVFQRLNDDLLSTI